MSPSNTNAFSNWLRSSEAARALGVSAPLVRRLAMRGVIVSVSTPLGRLIEPSSVERCRVERERSRERLAAVAVA